AKEVGLGEFEACEIRREEPGDRAAVHGVNARAFGRDGEADLVDALRGQVEPAVSLVALRGGVVVGHVFFSPVRIEGEGAQSRATALAPLAVLPEHQQHGIGSQLVRAGLDACHSLGEDVVFVLGHAGYYPRFGFQPAGPLGLRYRDLSPDPSFMVTELSPGALHGRTGWVRYAEAFERVVGPPAG
ncbi:MAG: N-acetyltransferase, partial [Myxococcota bacterium]